MEANHTLKTATNVAVILGLFFVTSWVYETEASSVVDLEIPDLTADAAEVVRLEVISKSQDELNGLPHWRLEVDVLEVFKGSSWNVESRTLYLPGGKESGGENEIFIHGMSELKEGGHYIVFLGEDEQLAFTSLLISEDLNSGQYFVTRAKEARHLRTYGDHHHGHHDHDHHSHAHHGHSHQALSSSLGSPLLRYEDVVEDIFSAD